MLNAAWIGGFWWIGWERVYSVVKVVLEVDDARGGYAIFSRGYAREAEYISTPILYVYWAEFSCTLCSAGRGSHRLRICHTISSVCKLVYMLSWYILCTWVSMCWLRCAYHVKMVYVWVGADRPCCLLRCVAPWVGFCRPLYSCRCLCAGCLDVLLICRTLGVDPLSVMVFNCFRSLVFTVHGWVNEILVLWPAHAARRVVALWRSFRCPRLVTLYVCVPPTVLLYFE